MDTAFLEIVWMGKPAWLWLGFLGVVGLLLALDLGVLHRTSRAVGMRESLLTSAGYIGLGLGFGGWVWWYLGADSGMAYLTGFALEKALAMDNVFVIAMIFAHLGVPAALQHRVLFWGILGVIVLRAAMIAAGAALIAQAAWVLYVFAVFLAVTGVKMLLVGDAPQDPAASPVLRRLRRHMNITDALHGERFFVRMPHPDTGRAAWFATPLFLALVLVELADVVFAVDSVPAIFAITTDPYIVYTSNIFAILGLRALYFALAGLVHRFRYLKQSLAVLLIFIGGKIFVADLLGLDKLPPALSLGVTVAILAAGILWSLWKTGPRGQGASGRSA